MDLKAIRRSLPLSIIALLLVVGVLYATTTIGTNISTDGTLTVGSTSTLNDTVTLGTADLKFSPGYGLDASAAGDLNIGTTTATLINIGGSSATTTFLGETTFSNTANVTYTPQTQTITGASATLTPTGTYILLTCNGLDTAMTLNETGARAGQLLVISNGAGSSTCSFTDNAGVQYVAGTDGTVILDDFDSISFIYDGSEWVQIGANNN